MKNIEATTSVEATISSTVATSQPFDLEDTATISSVEDVVEDLPKDDPPPLNFVTKNTFRSQTIIPVDKATVEDLWRRSLEQEANFRTRYWAMIGGVVFVAVVAIIAVVAPLAAQKDQYRLFEQEIRRLHVKDNVKKPQYQPNPDLVSINQRRLIEIDDPVGGIYSSARDLSSYCGGTEPLVPYSLGPSWECTIRDWEQWEATNGSLLCYMCATASGCKLMMAARCVNYSWRYLKMVSDIQCDCLNTSENKVHHKTVKKSEEKKMNMSLFRSILPRKKRTIRKFNGKLNGVSDWTKPHCVSNPPGNWGCALSDWNPDTNELGYNTKSKGYIVNYICTTRLKGCTIVRTLECGVNKQWKVIFTSSIVNDCVCQQEASSSSTFNLTTN